MDVVDSRSLHRARLGHVLRLGVTWSFRMKRPGIDTLRQVQKNPDNPGLGLISVFFGWSVSFPYTKLLASHKHHSNVQLGFLARYGTRKNHEQLPSAPDSEMVVSSDYRVRARRFLWPVHKSMSYDPVSSGFNYHHNPCDKALSILSIAN